jgi:hypothetical protein
VPKESGEYHACDREEDGLDVHDPGKVEGGAEAGPKSRAVAAMTTMIQRQREDIEPRKSI